MPTLAVAGCSFSDYTNVNKVYGDFLAELIGYEYLHLARGGGSNQRSFFACARAITNKKLVAGDIVIVQYTDPHRKLLSSFAPSNYINEPGNPEKWDTPYGTAWTTDYKMNSHQWQAEPQNKKLHLALEQGCINNEFETENLIISHLMFEALCKQHNITFIPLHTRYMKYLENKPGGHDQNDIKGNIRQRYGSGIQGRVFCEEDFIRQGTETKPSKYDLGWFDNKETDSTGEIITVRRYDNSHLSETGHEYLALNLHKHLVGHKIIENT